MKNYLLAGLILMATPAFVMADLTLIQQLGQKLYFDESLSQPDGQSCASCHAPGSGFADPANQLPVSRGVISGRFGERNAPTTAYAMYTPPLSYDHEEGYWEGGQFWDGRARGDKLGDPLAEQAMGPFLNPNEMGNPDKSSVIRDLRRSGYADLFEEVWGQGSLDDTERAFEQIAHAIAAFERSTVFAPFNSRYDHYLRACLQADIDIDDCAQGRGERVAQIAMRQFSEQEWRGLRLFAGANDNNGALGKDEGAHCSKCHSMQWSDADAQVIAPDWAPAGKIPPLFTDYSFHNIGVPGNPHHPVAGVVGDQGVGKVIDDGLHHGKFKAMTLRNIANTAPYSHNGYFRNLRDMVHFYNTRDQKGALGDGTDWPDSEFPHTRNNDELGQLGLSEADELAIVAFLHTLTDQPTSLASGLDKGQSRFNNTRQATSID